jgi:hypothetical protein
MKEKKFFIDDKVLQDLEVCSTIRKRFSNRFGTGFLLTEDNCLKFLDSDITYWAITTEWLYRKVLKWYSRQNRDELYEYAKENYSNESDIFGDNPRLDLLLDRVNYTSKSRAALCLYQILQRAFEERGES